MSGGDDERRRRAIEQARDRHRAAARRRQRIGIAVGAALLSFVVGVAGAAIIIAHNSSSQAATSTKAKITYHVYSDPASDVTQTTAAPPPTSSTTTATTPPSTSSTVPSTTSVWTLAHPPQGLRIVKDLIPYTPTRLRQMQAYSERHYGLDTWRLHPKAIVLHFTASPTYASAHAAFVSDAPNGGEEPGVCAQYITDQDGTVYEQVPPTIQCRHTIGLDDVAIGIENVQVTGPSSHWADQQILHRTAQITANLKLVKWLQAIYHIPTGNVIGHAMANSFYLFHDREGWTNDHSDWQAQDVYQFRHLLAKTTITR